MHGWILGGDTWLVALHFMPRCVYTCWITRKHNNWLNNQSIIQIKLQCNLIPATDASTHQYVMDVNLCLLTCYVSFLTQNDWCVFVKWIGHPWLPWPIYQLFLFLLVNTPLILFFPFDWHITPQLCIHQCATHNNRSLLQLWMVQTSNNKLKAS